MLSSMFFSSLKLTGGPIQNPECGLIPHIYPRQEYLFRPAALGREGAFGQIWEVTTRLLGSWVWRLLV